MLSKPMATAWFPTIATGVDLGICARLIGTLPDITATAARNRHPGRLRAQEGAPGTRLSLRRPAKGSCWRIRASHAAGQLRSFVDRCLPEF